MFLAHHVSLESIQLLKLGHILSFVTVSAAALAYTLAGLTNCIFVVEWCSWAQVIWQVDSGARSYLPRLGGGLRSITRSPLDPACYVVSQADNTVRTVSAHLDQPPHHHPPPPIGP